MRRWGMLGALVGLLSAAGLVAAYEDGRKEPHGEMPPAMKALHDKYQARRDQLRNECEQKMKALEQEAHNEMKAVMETEHQQHMQEMEQQYQQHLRDMGQRRDERQQPHDPSPPHP